MRIKGELTFESLAHIFQICAYGIIWFSQKRGKASGCGKQRLTGASWGLIWHVPQKSMYLRLDAQPDVEILGA